ncbi:hypothetical protein AB0M95_33600 [Sphaerisporangium sp. NPDC051017]|uniref:hypothetical protein n=1 Tax=Sphaerisporangium sp. NPDC051017 TaxID=3154636 RepID=UPI00342CE759
MLRVLVAYAVAGVGVIAFTFSGRSAIPRWEVVLPVAGIAWLVIGTLVRAGLRGIAAGYPEPTVWPENSTEAELSGVPRLPA